MSIKWHWGATQYPGAMSFWYDGYWFKNWYDIEAKFIKYAHPLRIDKPIRLMYGVSFGKNTFIGKIVTDSSEPEKVRQAPELQDRCPA